MTDLDALYAAIDEADALEGLPGAVARLCGTRSAMITRVARSGQAVYSRMCYWEPEAWETYFAQHFVVDPWRIAVEAEAAARPGRAVAIDSVLPPDKFVETTMFNECFRAIGDDTARCTGIIADGTDYTLIIGIHRAATDLPFQPIDVERLESAFEHVRRMFRTRDALANAEARCLRVEDMLESSGTAVITVDSSLRIKGISGAAQRILDSGDGMRCWAGRLALEDASAMRLLRAAVEDMINRSLGASKAVLCPRKSNSLWYRLAILPAGSDPTEGAIILIDDPADHRVPSGCLQRFAQVYGLTKAEAFLAAGLARHQTLEEIAMVREISKETARSHLKSLFGKVGVRRQVELVSLIERMP